MQALKPEDQLLVSEGNLAEHAMLSCHQSMSRKHDPAQSAAINKL